MQAEARPLNTRGDSVREPAEGLKQPGQVCFGDPVTVIGHVDRVMAMMSAGVLDPSPLVTHHMSLDDAVEAYALYDRREALKIVLKP